MFEAATPRLLIYELSADSPRLPRLCRPSRLRHLFEMTEYDYSPEGYQRYLDTQRRISKWVQNTNAHASEFRSPFGTFNPVRVSEESSSSRTRTSTVSSKPHGDRNIIERGRGMDDRERRHSMSATTFRQG
ncbi:MAG: hypothetical protein NXY57DRAFT_739911 [Lentinula lateritia]|nr:MAG: hypothetical protein NXY57DRAFT_739911 [Lentinula lateritia]